MIEEQIVFWIFTAVFCFLSIIKTLTKFLNDQSDAKPATVPSSTSTSPEAPPKNTSSSNILQLNASSNSLASNLNIFTVQSQMELIGNMEVQPVVNDQEELKEKHEKKKKKKHLMKSLINYSISFNSSFLIVGGLSESYLYGVRMVGNIISVLLGHFYSFMVIHPFLYSLESSFKTPYDYLQKRYNETKYVKIVCLIVAMFYYFAFMSLFLWGCAAVLNVLIPEINLSLANALLGVYSISGTLIGGYIQSTKINVFQFFVVFIGIIVSIKLTILKHATSIDDIWRIAQANKRTDFFDTNIDLTTRYTILNQCLSLPMPWCSKLGIFLPNYMRYRSITNKAKAKILFLSNIPIMIIVNFILIISGGIFCFIYFYGCDPHKTSKVVNKNQIGVYWIHMVLSQHIPSFSGIVFSCIIYYALIQHSISMAIISKTIYDEVIDPFILDRFKVRTVFRTKIRALLAVLISCASIAFSNLFQYAKNTMLSLFFVFNNSTNSPILGLFLVSMFNPYANAPGVTASFLLNVCLNYWMALGAVAFSKTRNQEFEHHTLYCDENLARQKFNLSLIHLTTHTSTLNSHHFTTHHVTTHHKTTHTIIMLNTTKSALFESNTTPVDHGYYPKDPVLFFMYSVAPIWWCLFSVLFNFVFGSLFSLIYSLVRTRSIDADFNFKEERKKYLFFYRRKHYF